MNGFCALSSDGHLDIENDGIARVLKKLKVEAVNEKHILHSELVSFAKVLADQYRRGREGVQSMKEICTLLRRAMRKARPNEMKELKKIATKKAEKEHKAIENHLRGKIGKPKPKRRVLLHARYTSSDSENESNRRQRELRKIRKKSKKLKSMRRMQQDINDETSGSQADSSD